MDQPNIMWRDSNEIHRTTNCAVHKVEATVNDVPRILAVKEVPLSSHRNLAHEAALYQLLSSTGAVPLYYGLFTDNESQLLCTEYLENMFEPLDLSVEQCLIVLSKAAQSLDKLHTYGVVHRDLRIRHISSDGRLIDLDYATRVYNPEKDPTISPDEFQRGLAKFNIYSSPILARIIELARTTNLTPTVTFEDLRQADLYAFGIVTLFSVLNVDINDPRRLKAVIELFFGDLVLVPEYTLHPMAPTSIVQPPPLPDYKFRIYPDNRLSELNWITKQPYFNMDVQHVFRNFFDGKYNSATVFVSQLTDAYKLHI